MTAKITGYDQSRAFLADLPDAVEKRVLMRSMEAACKVGTLAAQEEAAKHRTEKKSGKHLDESAAYSVRGKKGAVQGRVGFFLDGGQAGYLVEHGHRIAVGGTMARVGRDGKVRAAAKAKDASRTGKGVASGQVPPHPILAPAVERSIGPMDTAFTAEVTASAERVAQRLAKEKGAI